MKMMMNGRRPVKKDTHALATGAWQDSQFPFWFRSKCTDIFLRRGIVHNIRYERLRLLYSLSFHLSLQGRVGLAVNLLLLLFHLPAQ